MKRHTFVLFVLAAVAAAQGTDRRRGGAPASSAAPAAAANGPAGAAASAEDKRVQVVQRKLSTFVVQVDYLSIPAEKPAAGVEGEPKK